MKDNNYTRLLVSFKAEHIIRSMHSYEGVAESLEHSPTVGESSGFNFRNSLRSSLRNNSSNDWMLAHYLPTNEGDLDGVPGR